MIKTFDDLVKWIELMVPKDRRDQSPRDAARWFIASKRAEEIRENYDHKDMTYLILGGLAKLTEEDVTETISQYYDPECHTSESITEEDGFRNLLKDLQQHFRIY